MHSGNPHHDYQMDQFMKISPDTAEERQAQAEAAAQAAAARAAWRRARRAQKERERAEKEREREARRRSREASGDAVRDGAGLRVLLEKDADDSRLGKLLEKAGEKLHNDGLREKGRLRRESHGHTSAAPAAEGESEPSAGAGGEE